MPRMEHSLSLAWPSPAGLPPDVAARPAGRVIPVPGAARAPCRRNPAAAAAYLGVGPAGKDGAPGPGPWNGDPWDDLAPELMGTPAGGVALGRMALPPPAPE